MHSDKKRKLVRLTKSPLKRFLAFLIALQLLFYFAYYDFLLLLFMFMLLLDLQFSTYNF